MGVWRKSIALVAVLGFAVAGCGSDDDDDGGAAATDAPTETERADAPTADTTGRLERRRPTGDSAAAPSGEPIKLMTITTLNANGPTYENISITAEIAAKFINDNGGINGRPLEVDGLRRAVRRRGRRHVRPPGRRRAVRCRSSARSPTSPRRSCR